MIRNAGRNAGRRCARTRAGIVRSGDKGARRAGGAGDRRGRSGRTGRPRQGVLFGRKRENGNGTLIGTYVQALGKDGKARGNAGDRARKEKDRHFLACSERSNS